MQAERPGWMRHPHDLKSPKISNYFSFFGYLRGDSEEYEELGRRSKIFQNRDITCVYKMIIILRIIYSILYIDDEISHYRFSQINIIRSCRQRINSNSYMIQ